MKYTEIEKAFKNLETLGYIDYGMTIPVEIIERVIGEKFSTEWTFLGPLLALRKVIENNGYICTQRDIEDGSLRLVGTDEFASFATRNFEKAMERMKRLQNCVVNAKMGEFDNKEYKEYLHASNKINTSLNAMNSVLNGI
jgi:hypothetical protein